MTVFLIINKPIFKWKSFMKNTWIQNNHQTTTTLGVDLLNKKKIAPVRSIKFHHFFPTSLLWGTWFSPLKKTTKSLGGNPYSTSKWWEMPSSWHSLRLGSGEIFCGASWKKVTNRSSAGDWWGVNDTHIPPGKNSDGDRKTTPISLALS